jgi:site-specific recombinase XerD
MNEGGVPVQALLPIPCVRRTSAVVGAGPDKRGDAGVKTDARQKTISPLVTRQALADEFMELASKNVSPFDKQAVLWANRARRRILDGLMDSDAVLVLSWVRSARRHRFFGLYVIEFLQRNGAIPAELPDEDLFHRLYIRKQVEGAKWAWLDDRDQELIREYLKWFLNRGCSERSVTGYLSSLEWLIRIMKGKKVHRLAEILPEHIDALLGAWRLKGLVSQTCSRMLSDLKMLFTWLQEEKGFYRQPIMKRHIPRHCEKLPKPLLSNEIARLRSILDSQFVGKMHRALFYLIYSTGLRISEAIAVRTHDIDRDSKSFVIARGKGGKAGLLPIAGYALERIDEWLSGNPVPAGCKHIFHLNGFQITIGDAEALRSELVEASGVGFVWHRLRATFATRLAEMKVGPFEIQKLLRHSDLDTVLKYVKLGDPNVRRAYVDFVIRLLSSDEHKMAEHCGTAIELIDLSQVSPPLDASGSA